MEFHFHVFVFENVDCLPGMTVSAKSVAFVLLCSKTVCLGHSLFLESGSTFGKFRLDVGWAQSICYAVWQLNLTFDDVRSENSICADQICLLSLTMLAKASSEPLQEFVDQVASH